MLTFIDSTYVLNDDAKEIIAKETDKPFWVLYVTVYSSEGTILNAGDSWESWDDVLGCINTCWDDDRNACESCADVTWDPDESLRENVVYVRDIDAFLLVDPDGKIHGAQPANFLRQEREN